MNYKLNDIVEMKKQHPCGTNKFIIVRVGMEIKIRCIFDNSILVFKRRDFDKKIKKIIVES